jgi:hypothetical protein
MDGPSPGFLFRSLHHPMTTASDIRHQCCLTSSNSELPEQGLRGYFHEGQVFPELVHLEHSEDLHGAAVHPRKRRRLAVEDRTTLPQDVLEVILTRVSA